MAECLNQYNGLRYGKTIDLWSVLTRLSLYLVWVNYMNKEVRSILENFISKCHFGVVVRKMYVNPLSEVQPLFLMTLKLGLRGHLKSNSFTI